MATNPADSMQEGLTKILPSISQLKILPDADLQFLTTLEMQIVGYLKTQQQRSAQQAIQGAVGAGAMGSGGLGGSPAPSGPMGAPGPMSQGPVGGMAGGGMMGLGGTQTMPNPDELRRVLSNAGSG